MAPTRRFDTPHGGDEEERNHQSHSGGHDDDDDNNTLTGRSGSNTGERGYKQRRLCRRPADGQLEVNLLDLGVSAEDIAAMRRIDARIEEARRA